MPNLLLEKDTTYEVDEEQPIVVDKWKIKVPMKREGKFRFALISEDEGVLVD